MSYLYEILVPVCDKDGEPFDLSYHRKWDEKVREISHGLTIMSTAKGQWLNPTTGNFFIEKMIPVRIMCSTVHQINQIIDMTLEYYDQDAVMAYLISSQCIIKYKE